MSFSMIQSLFIVTFLALKVNGTNHKKTYCRHKLCLRFRYSNGVFNSASRFRVSYFSHPLFLSRVTWL
jgi:hypothetical protein